MTRVARIVVVGIAVLVAGSTPVEADWWDFLDQLHGPGPFDARWEAPNLTATIFCGDAGWLRIISGDQRGICYFVDVRAFESDADRRFVRVTATIAEFGPSYRLAPPLEIGFGMGVFHSDSEEVSANKLTISFPRVVFLPLFLIPGSQKYNDLGFFQVYFRETRFYPGFKQRDFKSQPGFVFEGAHDVVKSTGFLIDVVAAGRFIRRVTR